MTKALPAELRLLEKAKQYANGAFKPENSKSAKLLKRVAERPDDWLESYRLFGSLSWAMEMMTLGLSCPEMEKVATLLESMGIKGIQLNSPEGYRSLALTGIQSHRDQLHEELKSLKHELETPTKTLIRFDKRGAVASGYKRGYPLTSYIAKDGHYHKVYLDKKGKFQVVHSASELTLSRQDELFMLVAKVERLIPQILEAWELWKKEQEIALRIENLERFSDTQGAFA